ncbi:MAG TPA: DUF4129 domain-containing protein, partial [Candidatus Obscuribacterales bacterium]
ALLSLTGLAFLGWLAYQGAQRWRRQRRLQKLPLVERCYQHMLAWLAEQGYPKPPTQTPLEYAATLDRTPQFPQAAQVMAVVQAYVRWRYGQVQTDGDRLWQQVKTLQKPQKRP